MDWIRRNWPDLLIGLALLLVIGGIIVTLLNGGNLLPFGRGNTTSGSVVEGEGRVDPLGGGATGTVTENSAGNTSTTTNTTQDGVQGQNGDSVAVVDLSDNPNAATSDPIAMPSEQGGDGTIVPVVPTTESQTSANSETTAETTVENAVSEATAVAPETTDSAGSESTSGDSSNVIPASSVPTAPYRISVGAFGSAENAERRTQSFRDAGYPVFVADQGDLSLVLVGPYDSQGEAEQVKGRLESSGLEANPIIYEFRPNDGSTVTQATNSSETTTESVNPETTDAETTNTASSTSTSAPSTSTDSVPNTDSSGGYLQVGAYGSLESAEPHRTRLEELGFDVSSVEEGSFVKLLVGPYDDAGLATAQEQLINQGIESFIR
ncbi:MAG: SPOR domain-containing protein [Trueperaceae bacterium]